MDPGPIELEGIIVDIDYVSAEDRSIIRMALKSGDKVHTVMDPSFYPYFYLVPFNKELDPQAISRMEITVDGERIGIHSASRVQLSVRGAETTALKIEANNTRSIPKLSERLTEFGDRYEYDILFWKRYLIDKSISPLTGARIRAHKDGAALILDEIKASNSEPRLSHICFDIETYNPQIQPRPDKDPCIMISWATNEASGVITTKKIDKPFVTYCESEKAMILKFIEVIKQIDPDVIAGYNSSNFDIPYLMKRSKAVGIHFDITRYGEEAREENHGLVKAVKIPGRTNLDIYNVARFVSIVGASEKLLKINRFTLGDVYAAITGNVKITVDKKNIWQQWDGTKEELETLATYSLSDSISLNALYEFFVPLEIEVARVSGNTLAETGVSTTGQLVEYVLMRYASWNKEVVPNKPSEGEIAERLANPIEGAYVKTPEAGIYDNIAVFDFRGLYPSIIIANNIDPSTLSKDSADYYESPTGARFKKAPMGIVPKVLKLLISERSEVKKKYKNDPDNKSLASRSQALKILANSFYGYLGYARSRWYSRDCAASVTAFGRELIMRTMKDAEDAGFKVIYGDSVAADTQIRVNEKAGISCTKIAHMFRQADHRETNGKEYYFPKNVYVETISKEGKVKWGEVRYVVRHKPNKRMYRVWFTDYLHVDVTEDHSLIGMLNPLKSRFADPAKRLVNIKPEEIGVKASSIIVKKRSLRGKIVSKHLSKQFYQAMGFFIGAGSFSRNGHGKAYRLYLALGDERDELTKNLLYPLKRQGVLKNIGIMGEKGGIEASGLATVRFFEDNILESGKKAVPKFMFNETEENIGSFISGLYSSEGAAIMRNNKPLIRYTTIDESLANQIRSLLWEIGISSSISKERNQSKYNGKKGGAYSYHINIKSGEAFIARAGFLTNSKNKRIHNYKETSLLKKCIASTDFDISSPIKVEEIRYNGYVYDLEIEETHTFFANGVLVHNTDSFFLLLQSKTKDDALEFLDGINKKLPGSMELELEDFYRRGVFVGKKGKSESGAKKKYALLSQSGRIKIKGFELVRRDWSNIARETQRKVLEAILNEGSKEKAMSIVKDVVRDLKEGKVNLKDLVIYTQLRKKIDSYDSMSPELHAAKKALEEGAKDRSELEGGTIGYVITRSGSSISEKAEIEDTARTYDPDYYINHQVMPATLKILKELGFSEEELKGAGSQRRL